MIFFWKLAATPEGWNAPVLKSTITSLAWADVSQVVRHHPAGDEMLLLHRVGESVGEYFWNIGGIGIKGLGWDDGAMNLVDYGSSSGLGWTGLAWRERLNR